MQLTACEPGLRARRQDGFQQPESSPVASGELAATHRPQWFRQVIAAPPARRTSANPASGKISLEGGAPDLTLGQQAHYIAHSDASKSALTVTRESGFLAPTCWAAAISMRALQAVNLAALADYPAALLSAGQRRRLALASLALVPRAIWLLDEPSVGLDESAQKLLGALMNGHLLGRRAHSCRHSRAARPEPRQKSPPRGAA